MAKISTRENISKTKNSDGSVEIVDATGQEVTEGSEPKIQLVNKLSHALRTCEQLGFGISKPVANSEGGKPTYGPGLSAFGRNHELTPRAGREFTNSQWGMPELAKEMNGFQYVDVLVTDPDRKNSEAANGNKVSARITGCIIVTISEMMASRLRSVEPSIEAFIKRLEAAAVNADMKMGIPKSDIMTLREAGILISVKDALKESTESQQALFHELCSNNPRLKYLPQGYLINRTPDGTLLTIGGTIARQNTGRQNRPQNAPVTNDDVTPF